MHEWQHIKMVKFYCHKIQMTKLSYDYYLWINFRKIAEICNCVSSWQKWERERKNSTKSETHKYIDGLKWTHVFPNVHLNNSIDTTKIHLPQMYITIWWALPVQAALLMIYYQIPTFESCISLNEKNIHKNTHTHRTSWAEQQTY